MIRSSRSCASCAVRALTGEERGGARTTLGLDVGGERGGLDEINCDRRDEPAFLDRAAGGSGSESDWMTGLSGTLRAI
jgi:hypothetical protein